MATTVENRIARMDLDASGFIRKAQAALKSLAELDEAFEMKGAAKAAQSVSDAMSDVRNAVSSGAQAAATEMAVIGEAADETASFAGSAFDQMTARIATDFIGAQTAVDEFAVQTASSMQGLMMSTDGVSVSIGEIAQAARDAGTAVQEGFGGAEAAAMTVANSAAYAAGNVSAAISQADMAAQTAGADISNSAQQSAANAENAFANIGGKAEQIGQQAATGAKTGFAAAEASAAATAASIAVKLGLITAAVGVTTLGIYALVKTKGDSIRQSVHNVCDGIHNKIVDVKEKIHTTATNAVAAVRTAFQEGNLGIIKEKLHDAFMKGKEAVEKVLAALKRTLEHYFPETSAIVENSLSKLKGKFETKLDEIRTSVQNRTKDIRDELAFLKDGASGKVDEIRTSVQNRTKDIRDELAFLKDGASGKVEEIGENIRSKFGSLKDKTVGNFFGNINIEEVPAEKSGLMPSTLENVRQGASDARQEVDQLNTSLEQTHRKIVNVGADGTQSMGELAAAETEVMNGAQEMAGGMQNAADATTNVGEAIDGAATNADQLQAAEEDVANGAQEMAGGMQNAADATTNVGEAIDGAATNADQLQAAEEDVANGAQEAQESIEDLNKAVEENAEQTEEAKKATEDAAKEAKDYGKAAEKAGEKTEEAAEKGTEAGKGFSALFQALKSDVGGLKDAADEAAASGSVLGAVASAALIAGPVLIKKYREGLQEQTEDTDKLRDAVAALGDKAAAVYDKMQGMIASVSTGITGLVRKVEQFGEKVAKEFTVDQIKAGWGEYELKMGSVQTIMAGTGASLEEVNRRLDELNEYADRTIYSFSDMTNNIGKFTNQGVKLEDAVAAIKGISNEAALSGANAQQASNAMYNFAQALSTGYIQNRDWFSIENAMMATTQFKEELIKTAKELGTLTEAEKEAGDETARFVSTTTDNNGKVSEAFNAMSGFRDSLRAQWLTNDVLVKTLKKYTNETTALGQAAYHAAQDVKTGSQLMDTLKEAIGSGWAKTFELIVGDFEAAKKFWTGINNLISPILDRISNWRNTLIGKWADLGGRQNLIDGMKKAFEGLQNTVKAVKDALGEVFKGIDASKLKALTDKVADFSAKLAPTEEQLTRIKNIFVTLFSGVKSVWTSVKRVAEQVKGFIAESGALKGLGDAFGFITGSSEQATGAIDRLLTTVEGIVARVRAFLQEGIAETIKKHASNIKSLVEGVVSVLSAAKSVAEKFFSMRFDSLTSIIKGLLDAALNVVGVIGKIAKAVGDFVKKNDKLVASVVNIVKWILKVKVTLAILGPIVTGLVTKIGALVGTVTMAVRLATAAKKILPLLITAVKALKLKLAAGTTVLAKMGAAMLTTTIQTAALTAGITAIVAAIGLAVYAVARYRQKTREQAEAMFGLTEAHEAYSEQLKEIAENYRELETSRKKATEEAVAEGDNYKKLLAELKEIVDTNGRIKAGYEDRADVLLGSLKDGLDFEYRRTGDIIENYDEMIDKIDDLIEKKRVEAIVLADQEAYGTARSNIGTLSTARNNAKAEYERQAAMLEAMRTDSESFMKAWHITDLGVFLDAMDVQEQKLRQLKEDMEQADAAYFDALSIITNYEAFETATASAKSAEDYEDELTALMFGLKHATDMYGDAGRKVLYDQAKTFASTYKRIAEAYANETNDAAKTKLSEELTNTLLVLKAAMEEANAGGVDFAKALAEGFGVGASDVLTMVNNLGVSAAGAVEESVNYLAAYTSVYNYISGMESGLNDGQSRVTTAAGKVADAVTDTVTNKWQIHSPSKVAERQTEMFGQGMVDGLRKKLQDVREESRTLSEAVTSSTAQAFAATADMAEADFNTTLTITPVIDLTDVHKRAEAINGLFGATERLKVNGKLYAGVATERVRTEEPNGSDPLLAEVRSLRNELQDVSAKVGNMQMRIDGKTLIGWIAPEVDARIGESVAEKNRGL